ncbi:hypothetical protein KC316_g2747 [Hortaea werneckii]|nr:hypothetical protein KC324_g2662 [Hortaea werneckii]KAI7591638.1 hypothetical protein KC316_g2747 [Hortaea werneckii]
MASRNPSTNGSLPDHAPPPVAPTTVEKFLGIPTTISIHFACTLFALVETFAVLLSGVAGASCNSPRPRFAVPLVAALFSLLLWHQRRCVRDLLLTHSRLDCEAGSSTATAEAVMSSEAKELLMLFAGFQALVYLAMAFLMLVLNCLVGHAGAAIVAGALASGVGFLGFVEFLEEGSAASSPPTTGKKGGEEQEEQEEQEEHQEVAEASAASSLSTTGTGMKQPAQHLHRRLSCIPEEEGDDPSEHGGDNYRPADVVLSQQMQDLVWNRVRYLASRETLRERRRKKFLVRRAMRESQGESARGWSGDGRFSAMPADSAQRMREEDSERTDSDRDRDRDRQGEVDGGLRKGGVRMGGVLGGTRDDGDTRVAFSSGQPLFTTLPTMSTNSICPVPQQQTFPAMENLSHLPAAMDRTDPQQQAWHIEAMNRLTRAKDSEIAILRTQMAGMTRYFRTREEACRAAHTAEVANAWRNAQVLFEKVGKLEGRLTAEKTARKEGEWIGAEIIQQEERMGKKLGIFAQDDKKGGRWVEVENCSVRKQQQQQQKDEVVEEEVRKGNNVEGLVIDLPLCQNAGCFCHFPVVSQQPQQQQRQGRTSQCEQEVAIVSQDHVAEIFDEDESDDDDAFTIILDSDPHSLSSYSSHDVESPNNLTPPDESETPLCQNADCFCHSPVVVRPYLPHTGQTEQREKEQTAQNEDRRLIVPDHGNDVGSKTRDKIDNEDEEDEDEAFTIIVESRSPPPPSSSSSSFSSTPLSSHGVESL